MGSSKASGWGDRLVSASSRIEVCCDDLARAMKLDCDKCRNGFECADVLVHYSEQHNHYGLIVHDGGESWVKIDFCPWCGSRLS